LIVVGFAMAAALLRKATNCRLKIHLKRGSNAAPCPVNRNPRRFWAQNARRACKPDFVPIFMGDDHSSGRGVATRALAANPGPWVKAHHKAGPLFGIAPGGACHATPVARRAVSSYLTGSTIPRPAGRCVFCGAVRRVAPPGRYPAPSLSGVRTFLEGCPPRPSSSPRLGGLGGLT